MIEEQVLKILSWNINGINGQRKRNIAFNWLKKQNCDVYCLQETHIANKHHKYLTNLNLGQLFYSSIEKKKRGVAIYAKNYLKPSLKFKDNEGRMIAIEITSAGKKILIVNIYAPNGPKGKFFEDLQNKLSENLHEQVIVAGDFNGVINENLDKSKTNKDKKRIIIIIRKYLRI